MSEEIETRFERLERRIRQLEDHNAIFQLMATYGPAVDTRTEAAVAAMWAEGGTYDYGWREHVGNESVATLVNNDTHVGYVRNGCAHVMSLPLVRLDGNRAEATGYSRVYVHEGDGWKVERASANHWEFERGHTGWRVTKRINRPLDGSIDSRALLQRGLKVET